MTPSTTTPSTSPAAGAPLAPDAIRRGVREHYASIVKNGPAQGAGAGCGCGPACCTPDDPNATANADPASRADLKLDARGMSARMGYSDTELAGAPTGANLGLGCGNPHAIASLAPGETVLDLGSGAGFDAFLAADQVGPTGAVIGVDMTIDMVERARELRNPAAHPHVAFRLGEIEALPVADASIDVILSNCVVNLSPDQVSVYREAFRVLKPGGRLAISDIVATATLPAHIQADLAAHAGCVSGARPIGEIEGMLRRAGFEKVRVQPKDESRDVIRDWIPGSKAEDYVVSAMIEAVKPAV